MGITVRGQIVVALLVGAGSVIASTPAQAQSFTERAVGLSQPMGHTQRSGVIANQNLMAAESRTGAAVAPLKPGLPRIPSTGANPVGLLKPPAIGVPINPSELLPAPPAGVPVAPPSAPAPSSGVANPPTGAFFPR